MTTKNSSQNQYEVVYLENEGSSSQLILIDITNKSSSTPLQEEATATNHEILREAARRDLENYG